MEKLVEQIVNQIESKISQKPEIAVIAGSGLSEIADSLENKVIIPFDAIDGMIKTKVEGHKNAFVVGKLYDKNVIVMQGRFHLYDGFSAKQVSLPIYIFKKLGVETLIVTNASGGIADDLNAGDIMLIADHINHTGQNSLVGGPILDFGRQFIDMTEPYDKEYIKIVKNCAKDLNIKLNSGTYVQVVGPFYETKADINMFKILGCDAVGMSTAIEVESARHCGLRVLGLSAITNKAAGISQNEMTHEEVLENGKKVSKNLIKLIDEFVKRV